MTRADPTGLSPARPTQHFGTNFTENAKTMSTATRGNDQRAIVHPDTDWTGFLTGIGRKLWRSNGAVQRQAMTSPTLINTSFFRSCLSNINVPNGITDASSAYSEKMKDHRCVK
jgi:hypothetical protein